MPTVRTTFQPDKPIEVGDVEYLDLKRQGLIVEDEAAPTPAPITAAAAPAPPPAKKAASKES